MKASGNTILITGGGTGIGLALAARFLRAGNEVIICGRRLEKLREAQRQYPQLHVYQCDLSQESARGVLFEKVTHDFPKLNVLLNNAGMWVSTRLDRAESWPEARQQLETNLAATIHLTQLFAQHLSRQFAPVVFVTTSGLAHTPRAAASVYCATKAALHSYTQSLRFQLRNTAVQVIEIMPPGVQTGLRDERVNEPDAMPLDEYIAETMALLTEEPEATEIVVDATKPLRFAERDGVYEQRYTDFNTSRSP